MLDRDKVIQALVRKRSQFLDYSAGQFHLQELIRSRLDALAAYDYRSLQRRLEDEEWPGARPAPELDTAQALRIPFGHSWQNHQDARRWAAGILRERPVLAVDGSQITPTKDFSVPIGAVQIGWFVNPHRTGGEYVKDVEFEVLAPQDLAGDALSDAGDDDRGFPNWRVNQERFVRECEKLCQLMAASDSLPANEKPLCFFDGSFVISFAGQMRPERANVYIRAVHHLLACSEQYRVPLVGFVDSSYSRDLVTLLELIAQDTPLAGTEQATTTTTARNAVQDPTLTNGELDGQQEQNPGAGLQISDAVLLAPRLSEWGDRSPCFYCARADALSIAGRTPFYRDIVFTYVRLTADRPPARLEMPRWLLEENRVEDVLDLVRAECVVGAGYPYAVETADAVAVISQQDRQRFYALFQQFAEQHDLQVIQARKAASKRSRR